MYIFYVFFSHGGCSVIRLLMACPTLSPIGSHIQDLVSVVKVA